MTDRSKDYPPADAAELRRLAGRAAGPNASAAHRCAFLNAATPEAIRAVLDATMASHDATPLTSAHLKARGFVREQQAAADDNLTLRAGDVVLTRWKRSGDPLVMWSVDSGDGPVWIPRCLQPETVGQLNVILARLKE